MQARAVATVSSILEATAHILVADGYDRLTTNHVAARAGVSIGSLYQYFPSKESLVGELLDRHCEKLHSLFGEVFMRAQSLSPKELVHEVVGAIYRAKLENPELTRVLVEQIPRLGRLARLEEDMDQVTAAVERYLRAHESLLRVHDLHRAASFAVELGERLTLLAVIRDRNAKPESVIAEISDVVIRYLFA